MAQKDIRIGEANQGDGMTLFEAFTIVQENFDELYQDDTGDVNSVSAGTGISVDQTTGAVTVTNSAPNATHTGEVTGSGALTIANDVITYAKLGAEFTTSAAVGATTLDFSTAQVFTKANSGSVTYTITNADTGMVKDLILTGTGSFSITGGKLISGNFVESVTNFVQIVAQSSSSFWYSISQEQA
jgi:hypothetical protein